jgi:hypothetical protein
MEYEQFIPKTTKMSCDCSESILGTFVIMNVVFVAINLLDSMISACCSARKVRRENEDLRRMMFRFVEHSLERAIRPENTHED